MRQAPPARIFRCSQPDPKRTLMFDYSPSEFSRIRVHGRRTNRVSGVTDNQVFVQYPTASAPGAHKF